jgi:hypothetical protein
MKIKVKNYTLSPKRIFAGVRGSIGSVQFEMSFGKEWEGYEKSVVFRAPNGATASVSCEGGTVRVPDEIMNARGKIRFAAVGVAGDKRRMTLPAEMYVLGTVDGVTEK